MDHISANSEQHLRDLIAQAMAVQGEKADLNHIDVGAISDFDGLFEDSSFNGNISQWDVSQGIYAANMFKNSAFEQDVGGWAIEPCAKIQGLFEANWDGLAAQSPRHGLCVHLFKSIPWTPVWIGPRRWSSTGNCEERWACAAWR